MISPISGYDDAISYGPAIVGGKGWNLGRLHRYGFPVPKGGILNADVYTQFMQQPTLHTLCTQLATISGADATDPQTERLLLSLRNAIEATPLPAKVESTVGSFIEASGLLDTPLAIRSSATTEDGATTSFAGIHESFLNVNGLPAIIHAIKGCYASLWTPRAFAYRRHYGLSDGEVACAVVICAMVSGPMHTPPVAAGVAFSCDPRSGQRDRITINAAPGWGEAVVDGSISPEEITVTLRAHGDPLRIIRTQEQPYVLNDEHIRTLASLVLRVLWALGDGQNPQDVEWVYDGQRFWIVQARPATHVPHMTIPAVATLPVIWSNANIKDAIPGVQTPLSWSILQPVISNLLYTPCQAVGYKVPEGMERMRRFAGRGYFDLTAFQWCFCDMLGLMPSEFNRDIGGHQPEIPVPWQHPLHGWKGPHRILARLRLVRAILRNAHHFSRHMRQLRTRVRHQVSFAWTTCTTQELLTHLLSCNEQMDTFGPHYQFANLGNVWTDYLAQALEAAYPGQGRMLTSALMAGSREIESAEYGYQLYELAHTAMHDPAALTYLKAEPFDPQGWHHLPERSPFRQAFATFMEAYGHRGIYELELSNPRWNEEPSYLFDCIRMLLQQETLTAPYDHAHEKRQLAEAAVERLPWQRHMSINWLAKQARRGAAHREAGKSTLVQLLQPLRVIALEASKRMVAAHILQDKSDVFFLAWPDLIAFLRGEWDGEGARALVQDRRAQHAAWLAENPPDVFICDAQGEPAELPADFASNALPVHHERRTDGSHILHGLAASAGQASGRARIIRHPAEGQRLQTGEILVAPSTDPGWTPLFLRANAVIMEVGGYLSHGAIVAREFGLPAVINIPGLLERIKDGQYLTIDGDQGHIIIRDGCDTERGELPY